MSNENRVIRQKKKSGKKFSVKEYMDKYLPEKRYEEVTGGVSRDEFFSILNRTKQPERLFGQEK